MTSREEKIVNKDELPYSVAVSEIPPITEREDKVPDHTHTITREPSFSVGEPSHGTAEVEAKATPHNNTINKEEASFSARDSDAPASTHREDKLLNNTINREEGVSFSLEGREVTPTELEQQVHNNTIKREASFVLRHSEIQSTVDNKGRRTNNITSE